MTATPTAPVKTRFAPSPTGAMHIGNARTALFNALFARKMGGTFLLRMEDSDAARSQTAYETLLLEDLEWLGLAWDEGPYRQSEREAVYDPFYARLVAEGHVYPCFCTVNELALSRKQQLAQGKPPRYSGKCRYLSPAEIAAKQAAQIPYTWRFRVPDTGMISFIDAIKGPQHMALQEIGDFIIRRQDQSPAFFFCNAIDDALMDVTHVIRGEDHLTNTPRQLLILQALQLRVPVYAHLPMIVGADRQKLSKRNGSVSIQDLRTQGFLPRAVNNYLARLGHHYPPEWMNVLMDPDQLAQALEWDRMGHAAARHDHTSLHAWQKQAVYQSDVPTVSKWVRAHLPTCQDMPDPILARCVEKLKANWVLPVDAAYWIGICTQSIPFRNTLPTQTENWVWIIQAGSDFFEQAATQWLAIAKDQPAVDETGIRGWIQACKAHTVHKGPAFFKPLRLALTGSLSGPELPDIMALIPAAEIHARLIWAADAIRG